MLKRLNTQDGAVENSTVFAFAEIFERWQIADLQGSEKQVSWATSIAIDRIHQTNSVLNGYSQKGAPREKLDIVLNKLLEKLENNDAKYWIESRNVSIDKFLLK